MDSSRCSHSPAEFVRIPGVAIALLIALASPLLAWASPFSRGAGVAPAPPLESHCEVPDALKHVVDGSDSLTAEKIPPLQDHVQRVVEIVSRSVVGIVAGASAGSGVIVSADGLVLTAGHVIRGQKEITVLLPDGTRLPAKTLGSNQTFDTGMAQITAPGPHPFSPIGRSDDLREGAWCLSLGQPLGFDLRRRPPVRLGRVLQNPPHALQTDCTIVSGDSGGPLFDLAGQVIGVHSRIGSGLTENIHIPIQDYTDEWESLLEGKVWGALFRSMGDPNAPYLGARPGKGEGAIVGMVIPNGPAARAGLLDGDQILSFGAVPIRTFTDIAAELARRSPGDSLMVEVLREDGVHEIDLVLGARGSAELPAGRRDATPSLTRSRAVQSLFESIAAPAQSATVLIHREGFPEPLAYGVVAADEGLVVTKASELEGIPQEDIRCVFADGRELETLPVAVDEIFDLALLRVAANDLTPANWSEAVPTVGAFLVTPLGASSPPRVGVLSVEERHQGRSRAFMGVTLADRAGGAAVGSVVARSAADEAGLRVGDVIVVADGSPIGDTAALQAELGRKAPGDPILLVLRRGDQRLLRRIVLGEREEVPTNRRTRAIMGDVSRRNTDFPGVVQHDTVLVPNQCGGPVVDVSGRVVGVNIARSSRVESYLVPTRTVLSFVRSATTTTPTMTTDE